MEAQSITDSWHAGSNAYASTYSLEAASTAIVTNDWTPVNFESFSGAQSSEYVSTYGTDDAAGGGNNALATPAPDDVWPGSIPEDPLSPACWDFNKNNDPDFCHGQFWTNQTWYFQDGITNPPVPGTGFLQGINWKEIWTENTNYSVNGTTYSYTYSSSSSPTFFGEWLTESKTRTDTNDFLDYQGSHSRTAGVKVFL